MILFLLIALVISIYSLRIIIINNYSFAAFLLQAYISVQILFLIIYFIINNSFKYSLEIIGDFDFEDDIFLLSILYITISLMCKFYLNRKVNDKIIPEPINIKLKRIAHLIVENHLLAVIIILIWPIYTIASLIIEVPLFFIIAILHNLFGAAVLFLPFLRKRIKIIFLLILFCTVPISIIYGARGLILYPLAFYGLGWIIASKKPYLSGFKLALISAPILFISSFFAVARYAVRGNESMSLEVVSRLWETTSNLFGESISNIILAVNIFCERIIQWPILVGIHENGIFGGRGFNDLIDEVYFAINLTNIGSDSFDVQNKIIDSGFLYGGVKYLGYKVSVGWTVPLNILADGIIRSGFFGAIFYFFIFLVIIRCLEKIANKLNDRISTYIYAFIPGLVIIKFPETHSILILKNISYLLIFIFMVIIVYKSFGKLITKKVKYENLKKIIN